MSKRIVMLGIDAGSSELLLRWSADGTLPALGEIRRNSLFGRTESLPGTFVGSTWASLYTGVNPGRHGIHSLRQIEPGTYDIVDRFPGTDCREPAIWDHLSHAGRRVAILDVPLSGPGRAVNGIQTIEYGGHDAHLGFQTTPASLAEELVSKFGPPTNHPVSGNCTAERTIAGMRIFSDKLVESAQRKADLTLDIMNREPWDLLLQVFTESHCAGHLGWHLHDSAHPAYDPEVAASVGDPIRAVYRAIDGAIGRIRKTVGEDTTLIVFSSHGMGPCHLPYGLMSSLLITMGYALPTRLHSHHGGRYFHDRVVRAAMRRASASTPGTVRNLLRPVARPIRKAIGSVAYPSREDYRRSRCFAMHDTPSHSGIRINLAGREPGGLVQPGSEADHLCDELTSALMSLRNLDTDETLISRIIPADTACSGPYLDHLPDLFIEWNQANPVSMIGSPLMGDMACELKHPRTGHHRAGGFFLASGPGIEPGVLEETYSVMDYAPTLAELLDAPADNLDGVAVAPLLGSRCAA